MRHLIDMVAEYPTSTGVEDVHLIAEGYGAFASFWSNCLRRVRLFVLDSRRTPTEPVLVNLSVKSHQLTAVALACAIKLLLTVRPLVIFAQSDQVCTLLKEGWAHTEGNKRLETFLDSAMSLEDYAAGGGQGEDVEWDKLVRGGVIPKVSVLPRVHSGQLFIHIPSGRQQLYCKIWFKPGYAIRPCDLGARLRFLRL